MRTLTVLLLVQSCSVAASTPIDDGLMRNAKHSTLAVDAQGDFTEIESQSASKAVDMSVDRSGTVALEKSSSYIEELSHMDADDLMAEIKKMVASKDPNDNSKIKVIQDIVKDELLPKLQATRDTEAKELTAIHGGIEKCNSQSSSTQDTISKTTEKAVVEARSGHSTCRQEDIRLLERKTTKCGAFKEYADSIAVPAELPKGQTPDAMAEYLKVMDAYFCGRGKRAGELKQACDDATAAYKTAQIQCNAKQTLFESSFCQWRTRMTDACTETDNCYDRAVQAYGKRYEVAQGLVKQWEVEHASLQKILCYTKVWLRTTKQSNHAQYKECDGLKPDTSSMHIKKLAVPDKQACDLTPTQHYPGTSGFLKDEYSAFAKHTLAVTPCVKMEAPSDTKKTVVTYVISKVNEKCTHPITTLEECKTAAGKLSGGDWDGERHWADRCFGCLWTVGDGDVNFNNKQSGECKNKDQVPICKKTETVETKPKKACSESEPTYDKSKSGGQAFSVSGNTARSTGQFASVLYSLSGKTGKVYLEFTRSGTWSAGIGVQRTPARVGNYHSESGNHNGNKGLGVTWYASGFVSGVNSLVIDMDAETASLNGAAPKKIPGSGELYLGYYDGTSSGGGSMTFNFGKSPFAKSLPAGAEPWVCQA